VGIGVEMFNESKTLFRGKLVTKQLISNTQSSNYFMLL